MAKQTLIVAIAFAFLLGACSGPEAIPARSESQTVVFEPGAPNFDMEAVAALRGGQPGIDIYTAIPQTSLSYVKRGDRFEATYDLTVRVLGRDENVPVFETIFSDSLVAERFETTRSFEDVRRQDFVPVPPGEYTVELALEDAESGARAERRSNVEISDVSAGEPLVGDVLLKVSVDGGAFVPAVSLHLPGGYDSLRAVTDLHNLPDAAGAQLRLIRYRTDTTIALPPFYFSPGPFTLPYIGVDYDHGDTLQTSRRQLADAGDHVSIEFALPVLERGVYNVELVVTGDGFERMSRRRFAVMSPSFPHIASLDEMVNALRYIARDREWEHIAAARSHEEKRHRFDAFWAGLVPNREAAARLLKTYYDRVEEANILYSNHKEGWKTDFGMIYIVFGPPAYTEEHYIRDIWYYFAVGGFFNRRLPPFVFRRSTAYGFGGLFEHYILQRDADHEYEWRRRVGKWRDGQAM